MYQPSVCPTYNDNPKCKGEKDSRAAYCRSCATMKSGVGKYKRTGQKYRHVSDRFYMGGSCGGKALHTVSRHW